MQELLRKLDLCDAKYALLSPGLQHVDANLNVTSFRNVPMALTSWTVPYYELRANFDGLVSEYCTQLREEPGEQGEALYDLGKRVTGITYGDGRVELIFDDLPTGGSECVPPDLVIAADGSNSSIRQLMLPNLKKPYAG